jgi:hypothetical protein
VILIRALLAVALILNGMAVTPAVAMHAAPGVASHSDHHPQGPAPGDSHADHSSDVPGGDCCEGAACDCGCAVPQAASLPVMAPYATWQAALPEFAFAVKSFHSGPRATPFRPPA